MGGFLYGYGYDTGVVGIALPYIGTSFGSKAHSYTEKEIAAASCTIGSIFGAGILGMFADKWRCKFCLLVANLFFTAGAIIIASSFSQVQVIAGHLTFGVGVGGAGVICPLYITELAPTAVLGRCVGTNGFCNPWGRLLRSPSVVACSMFPATGAFCLALAWSHLSHNVFLCTDCPSPLVCSFFAVWMTRLGKCSRRFTNTPRLRSCNHVLTSMLLVSNAACRVASQMPLMS